MQPDMKKRAFALAGVAGAMALSGLLTSCTTVAPRVATPGVATPGVATPGVLPAPGNQVEPPAAPREFRAAWVSTVANIDWPTKQNLSAAQQQAEAIAILDRAKDMNLNAIVLQVRPSADAIYPSKLEPWTEYLNGAQGEPPKPYYDPLKFWVTEAHARGLELHAWFNPYRARHATAKSANVASHISRANPAAVKTYGKFLWMDPAEESASKQTLDVILDVVRRYDIDGVHLDDYFYPYPIEAPGQTGAEAAALDGNAPKTELDFPDQPAWDRYVKSGGKLDRPHWRRDNVNRLIKDIYAGVHREKSWVRFGISPFGIARPDRRPPTISGFSQYDKLYADAELWLENGWVDYFVPQLYWPISQTPQAYDTLLDYWLAQNPKGRHLWPGLFTSRIGAATRSYAPAEVLKQIQVTRERPAANGHVHFSMAALMENREGITDQLKAVHYGVPALVPATPWLGNMALGAPTVRATRAAGGVKLKMASAKAAAQFAIWSRHGEQWKFAVAPGSATDFTVADDAKLGPASAVFVSAVDRLGNEGKRASVTGIAAK